MKNILHIKAYGRGLTLIETLVTIGIFTVIMFALMESISSFYRINAYTIAQAYQVDHARRGTDLMVRDLREMTFADNGTFPLAIMERNRVGFYSDIDRDDSVEYVEYSLASTTLIKKIYNASGTPPVYSTSTIQATTTISEYVQNNIQNVPIFLYYDEEGVASATSTLLTDIRFIRVSVIVNIDPIRDPGEYVLRGSASLRNLSH